MNRILTMGLSILFCLNAFAQHVREELPPAELNLEQKFAMIKLRTHCTACHGVGDLRFIYSDDDKEFWDYIHTQKAPRSKKLWSEAIREVLTWPSDAPPDFDKPLDPTTGRDWMPKGFKRLELAEDHVGDLSARQFILMNLD